MPTDWSIDANRDALREQWRGKEAKFVVRLSHERFMTYSHEFVREIGIGDYSHVRLVDWLTENYPEGVADVEVG